jgi:tetratricopeptide (TPR) repeat protein
MKVFLILALLQLAACGSSGGVKLNSVPEGASVTLHGSGGSARDLGKTPLQLSGSELSNSGGRLSSLTISKEGHKEHHVLLGRDRGSESYDILVTLQPQMEDPKVLDIRSRQERLAKLLVQAHNLTAQKRYDEAERVLGGVLQDYPQVSVGHDLMGNVNYLQKDLKSALRSYERSLQLNPENIETRQMIDRLKGMLQ